MMQELNEKKYIIGYGDRDNFIEIVIYDDKLTAIKQLKHMKKIIFEFTILDYRIEVFLKENKINSPYIYANETIRI